LGRILERLEQLKASVRSRAEHPFRMLERQFGYVTIRYRAAWQRTPRNCLFALVNIWMARRELLPTR